MTFHCHPPAISLALSNATNHSAVFPMQNGGFLPFFQGLYPQNCRFSKIFQEFPPIYLHPFCQFPPILNDFSLLYSRTVPFPAKCSARLFPAVFLANRKLLPTFAMTGRNPSTTVKNYSDKLKSGKFHKTQ